MIKLVIRPTYFLSIVKQVAKLLQAAGDESPLYLCIISATSSLFDRMTASTLTTKQITLFK